MQISRTIVKILPIIIAGIFLYAYSSLALQKYSAHHFRGDITAYAQGVWNTLYGHPFASTFNYSVHEFWSRDQRIITENNSNILGIHFNLILLLFLPLYSLFPEPTTLVFIQALAIVVSSIFIYLIAIRLLKSKTLALLIQVSYLMNLNIISAVLSEFHAYPLTVLFSGMMIYAYYLNKSWLYYISLLLLLTVQENAALVAIALGVYFVLKNKKSRLIGTITFISGVFSLLITTKILIPHISPLGRFLFDNAYGSSLGSSMSDIIINSVRHPELFLKTMLTTDNLRYLGKLLLPVLPLTLLSPIAIFSSLIVLAPNLLSSASILKSMSMHYEAAAIPLIYFSLILSLSYLKSKISSKYFACYIILIMLPVLAQYKLFTSKIFSPRCVVQCNLSTQRDIEIAQMISLIPAESSVSTQDYLSIYLANRPQLYLFPVNYQDVDYLPLSTGAETWPLTTQEHQQLLSSLEKNKNYSIIYHSDSYLLFKKIH